MSFETTFPDIKAPDFMLYENTRLLEQDGQPINDHLLGETSERAELFRLMHETQEEYEAAQRAALEIDSSQFDIHPDATTSIYNIHNHSVDNGQYASSSKQNLGTGNFNDFFGQQSVGGWDDTPFALGDTFMNPYYQYVEGLVHPDTLGAAISEGGGSTGMGSWVDVQDGVEVGSSSNTDLYSSGEYLHATYGENDNSDGQFIVQNDNSLSSTPRAHHLAAAEEPIHEYIEHAGEPLSANVPASGGPAPVVGNVGNVTLASYTALSIREIQNEGLIGGLFPSDFPFDFLSNIVGDGGVSLPDIASNVDVGSAATNEGTASETESESDDAKDGEKESESTNPSDNKENEAADLIVSPATDFSDREEAALPLENSNAANIVGPSKGKQRETDKPQAEKDNSVAEADVDELITAPTIPAGFETGKPTIGPTAGTSKMTNPAKRKADNAVETSDANNSVDTGIAGPSKAKQPPKKKVRLAKDEVAAAESSGVLFCKICFDSPLCADVPTFNRRADLNRHERSVHGGLEQLTCACGVTFSKRYALNRHQLNFGH